MSRFAGSSSSTTEANLEYAATLVLDVFRRYDTDGDGTLHKRELRNLLRQCGARLTTKQCDDIIEQLDSDGDGVMNFAEFMAFLGRLYQLQFFGNDPGQFWDTSQDQPPQPPPRPSHTRRSGHEHRTDRPPLGAPASGAPPRPPKNSSWSQAEMCEDSPPLFKAPQPPSKTRPHGFGRPKY
ncbi:unnamed protein product [Clavelina lepadiformis]|uniref:EF-hand domain-containing protein n=1 Tax=Clavelina lepadiformis TaxID=159417 RepID=A0ABP0GML2_CLALP